MERTVEMLLFSKLRAREAADKWEHFVNLSQDNW
tara:strand:- start:2920 stop:3021 length:102 start_codon:yes stop_codon:yes gene_type:complete